MTDRQLLDDLVLVTVCWALGAALRRVARLEAEVFALRLEHALYLPNPEQGARP